MRFRLLALLLLLLGVPLALAADHGALRIMRVTPSGQDVVPGQEIVISFDRPMVPLGRMERAPEGVPVTITPAISCAWRWLDTRALACRLNQKDALDPSTRYQLRVEPGAFTAEDGSKLEEGLTHEFMTQRPMVTHVDMREWQGPATPQFRVKLNQEVAEQALEASLDMGGKPVNAHRAEPWEGPYTWLVQPAAPLAIGTEYDFAVKPGMRPLHGIEPGVEQRTLIKFKTFPEFKFLGISCLDAKDPQLKRLTYAPARIQYAQCEPQNRTELLFTSPPTLEDLKPAFALTPDPAGHLKDYDPWDNYGYAPDKFGPVQERYGIRLPYTLKPMSRYRLQLAGTLRDVFGRELKLPVDLALPTGHRAAAAILTHSVSVLEQGVDSEVPMVAANIDHLKAQYTRVTAAARENRQTHEIPVQPIKDLGYTMPLDVRGMLDGKTGAVQGRLDTDPPTLRLNRYDDSEDRTSENFDFFAEVTPWSVHAKLGHYNTLVWVTGFATGAPVQHALVRLGTFEAYTSDDGLAELPGTERIDPQLSREQGKSDLDGLAVTVLKDGDMAMLPLTYDFSVDAYRASHYQIWSQQRTRHGHLKSWGTTAQGVYRAGDTIDYKVYLRQDALLGLAPPPRGQYQLQVRDPQGQVVHERRHQQLSAFGTLDGKFTVAKTGNVGWYQFVLTPEFDASVASEQLALEAAGAAKPAAKAPETSTAKPKRARRLRALAGDDAAGAHVLGEELLPMRVLVSDFTPAPFKVQTELNEPMAVAGTNISALARASLYAGGPYAQAQGRLAARVDFGGQLKPRAPQWQDFSFNTSYGCDAHGYSGAEPAGEESADLSAQGEIAHDFEVYQSSHVAYGRYIMEGSAKDDRGRSVANTISLPYYGTDRYVGLRYKGWLLEQRKPANLEALVLDTSGAAVAGSKVSVAVSYEHVTAARVQDGGNAYITHYNVQWEDVKTCELVSGKEPVMCSFTPTHPGSYRIVATIEDTHGRTHQSCDGLYATGQGDFMWQQSDDYGLDMVTEKTDYHVGEHARFLVKNPYPGAMALVTVERYGAIDHWVQKLVGSTPVIDVPVKPDYLPGFYLSVVVQSPRVAAPPPQGEVDLGKPAFRMGYAKVTVTDPYKQLEVKVQPDRERYQPRERAHVKVQAQPRHGVKGEPVELAVAVVDESVFDLIQGGIAYFDPEGLRALDNLDLGNYSLLTRLIGRQKFEKKGATPGGDGGADLSMRSVDKYVAYWNPAVRTDEDGNAQFDVTLPDNLTAWKILVLGATVSDRLGLGAATVKVSKDTEIRPVMPNQVTGGDRFKAAVSVMNRAKATRTLSVKMKASGAAQGEHSESVTLKGFERRVVAFEVATQPDAGNLQRQIVFSASAGDASSSDALKLIVPVRARRPTVTAASYGTLTSGSAQEKFMVPGDILPGGSLGVSFTPSLLGAMDGAFVYARDYPYACWEQRLTKAIMAAHYLRLKDYLPPEFSWPEAASLPAKLFEDATTFQTPDGGFGYWDAQAGHVNPYLSAFTALGFEWLRAAGYTPPEAVSKKLDAYLQGLLRNELPNYTPEAAAAVRATVLASLAQRGKLKKEDLARFQPAIPRMGLFGEAMFLSAATRTPGSGDLAEEVMGHILSRGQESAGKFILREADPSLWTWLVGSETRSNCAALSALIAAPDAGNQLADLPGKLARAVVQSRHARQDHWYNTQENLFCLAALADYATKYEAVTPAMTLTATLDGNALGQAKFSDKRAPAQTFARPVTAADLGKTELLDITHEGQGRAYYTARVNYVEKDENARAANAGMEIERTYSVQRGGGWQPLASPLRIKRGELVRVDLTLHLPSARQFVAVDDPVPGGLEPVNTDLATASGYDAAEDRAEGDSSFAFYHHELRHDAARVFADYAEEGTYHLHWIGQAIAVGEFTVGPPHVEEMYDPDVFGNDVPAKLIVEENDAHNAPSKAAAPPAQQPENGGPACVEAKKSATRPSFCDELKNRIKKTNGAH